VTRSKVNLVFTIHHLVSNLK